MNELANITKINETKIWQKKEIITKCWKSRKSQQSKK